MNSRARRLGRLVDLRGRQLDLATTDLRAAQSVLLQAEKGVHATRQALRAEPYGESKRPDGEAASGWLLKSAEDALLHVTLVQRIALMAQAATEVERCRSAEVQARREHRQMETVHVNLQRERACERARIEQQQLDEAARRIPAIFDSRIDAS